MLFETAVKKTPDVAGQCRPGLQALSSRDVARIRIVNSQRLSGSVNIDLALEKTYPEDPRWDYAVGYRATQGEKIYWIEIHPANEGAISDVLAKLAWLKRWLNDSAPMLHRIRAEFVWVSSGRTSFNASSPQAKKLAQSGLRNVGKTLVIPDH